MVGDKDPIWLQKLFFILAAIAAVALFVIPGIQGALAREMTYRSYRFTGGSAVNHGLFMATSGVIALLLIVWAYRNLFGDAD